MLNDMQTMLFWTHLPEMAVWTSKTVRAKDKEYTESDIAPNGRACWSACCKSWTMYGLHLTPSPQHSAD